MGNGGFTVFIRLTPAWAGKTASSRASARWTATHPRVGGEDVSNGMEWDFEDDSPPRGRGRPRRRLAPRRRHRLTPAWAGKTAPRSASSCPTPTHPRVGGEDQHIVGRGSRRCDSPPRGRGRPGAPRRSRGPQSTHPRVGGEDRPLAGLHVLAADSPPRGRGRRPPRPLQRPVARLTPAWAGKTLWIGLRCRVHSTHPRVGGEDTPPISKVLTADDSPPRGRGRQMVGIGPLDQHRLTPAWAGKTPRPYRGFSVETTHPRVGGEDHEGMVLDGWHRDSPPRGRGRRCCLREQFRGCRLTPAWAGKTCRLRWQFGLLSTHPRVGGEDYAVRAELVEKIDSPPRGRGRRPDDRDNRRRVRLTPAWAGKT